MSAFEDRLVFARILQGRAEYAMSPEGFETFVELNIEETNRRKGDFGVRFAFFNVHCTCHDTDCKHFLNSPSAVKARMFGGHIQPVARENTEDPVALVGVPADKNYIIKQLLDSTEIKERP